MIAQIVFDLPLDGPFDYVVPPPLENMIAVGMRVKVSFGPRPQTGFVVALMTESTIPKLKSIQALVDTQGLFNTLDLQFAQEFCAYYGCSLGEALGSMHRSQAAPSLRREAAPQLSLYNCSVDQYVVKIQSIMDGYRGHAAAEKPRFLILVPDTFRAIMLSVLLKDERVVKIGMRSCVFECDGCFDCVIMVDEGDDSYQQEQTPMYETRTVLLMRSRMYGFDIAFIAVSASVELMAMVRTGDVKLIEGVSTLTPLVTMVDLSNYKFMPGMVSPPVYEAIQAALKVGKKSVLVVNRRGSYRITCCVDCTNVLKCKRCDTPMIYSRSAGQYSCRHCTHTENGDVVCSTCHKSNWKAKGIGVEQIQAELKKHFLQAKILSFERETKTIGDFDILVATQAVLGFQGLWQVPIAAFIDFDAELNRLDMRSSSHAFSLAHHMMAMTTERLFIQTRQINHHVMTSLRKNDRQLFYDEELKMRQELGFSPFKHWIKISVRSKSEKSAKEVAEGVYNQLSSMAAPFSCVMPPSTDGVVRRRDQFHFHVMLQADVVMPAMACVKTALGKIKRRSKAIIALNVDP